jgi:multiple sugar transport system ATP-binding protein
MASVRLDKILRRYSKTSQIGEISLTIPDGEFWVFVGPSGCGKSTLLRTIAGLETPTSGDLWIGDRNVTQLPARQRDVAMVFQNYALYPHMSVAENLAFGLKMRGSEPSAIRSRVQEVAVMLDIAHLLDRKPKQLSGGQQQRVALGRAIARSPQVFLLDEPLSNLDAQLRDGTRAELKQLHQRVGITTLYVTHDQTEAMTLADQIVVLDQGQIQQIAEPKTMYQLPENRMVATFMGNPPMNVFGVNYTGDGFQLGDQMIPTPIALRRVIKDKLQSGMRFDFGIRPEAIRVEPALPHVRGTVILVEPLGREMLVRVGVPSTGGAVELLMLMAGSDPVPTIGSELPLAFDLKQMFLFECGGGDRIYPVMS